MIGHSTEEARGGRTSVPGLEEDAMDDWKIAPAGVHQDIVLENNFIQSFNDMGVGIYLGSIDGAVVRLTSNPHRFRPRTMSRSSSAPPWVAQK